MNARRRFWLVHFGLVASVLGSLCVPRSSLRGSRFPCEPVLLFLAGSLWVRGWFALRLQRRFVRGWLAPRVASWLDRLLRCMFQAKLATALLPVASRCAAGLALAGCKFLDCSGLVTLWFAAG